MKHSLFILCLASLVLLFAVVVLPVAADPSISSISPTSGYRGDTVTITITGTGFDLPTSSTTKYVRLYNEDTTNITASSISSKSSTKIVAKFSIGSSKTKGDWYVVVVNDDGTEAMSDEFVISDEMSLSAISPTSGQTNDDDVSFTLTGTGLSDVEEVYLYKSSSYDNISASDIDVESSSKITGTFDLSDVTDVTYKVCVEDSYGSTKCESSVTFEVTTDAVGEIDVSSSPSSANIYLDEVYMGTTPYALTDVIVGSHVIKLTKDGYSDWSKIVKVTEDDTTSVSAELSAIATSAPTTVPTTVYSTTKTPLPVTTVKITSIKTTTAAATTTQASPVELGVIIGAIGLGMVVLHRKH